MCVGLVHGTLPLNTISSTRFEAAETRFFLGRCRISALEPSGLNEYSLSMGVGLLFLVAGMGVSFLYFTGMARITRPFSFILSVICIGVLGGCAGLNDPYDPYYGGGGSGYGSRPPPPPGYGGYYGGSGGYDYGYERAQDRRERERLEEERRRLERERVRLERERERMESYQPPPPPPARREPERCPPGFSPSENKCSREERRRGCQDIRMPGGLGCVKR